MNLSSAGGPASATVGSYPILASAAQGIGLSNYTIFYTNGTLTVGAASLGVTATDTNKVYGSVQTFAGTEFTLSGHAVQREHADQREPEQRRGGPATATVGSYPIVASAAQGIGLSNYTIFYTNGTADGGRGHSGGDGDGHQQGVWERAEFCRDGVHA